MIVEAEVTGSRSIDFYDEHGNCKCSITTNGDIDGSPDIDGRTVYIPRKDGRTERWCIYDNSVLFERTEC